MAILGQIKPAGEWHGRGVAVLSPQVLHHVVGPRKADSSTWSTPDSRDWCRPAWGDLPGRFL